MPSREILGTVRVRVRKSYGWLGLGLKLALVLGFELAKIIIKVLSLVWWFQTPPPMLPQIV